MQIQNAAKLCDQRGSSWIVRYVDTRRYPNRYRVALDIGTAGGEYSLPIEGWDGSSGGTINGEVLVLILTTAKPAGKLDAKRGTG